MATKIKMLIGEKKLVQTKLGANLLEGDERKLAGWTNIVKTIGFQNLYYNLLSANLTDVNAIEINNFLTATGTTLGIHYPIENDTIAREFPNYIDRLKSKFKLGFVQWSNESLSTPSAMTNALYISRCLQMLGYDPALFYSWDCGLMSRYPNEKHVERNKEIAKQSTPPITGRQYAQLADSVKFTTDQTANLKLVIDYFDAIFPGYQKMFKDNLPNLKSQNILQWFNENFPNKLMSNKPVGNYAIGKMIETILKNTEFYSYLHWMSLGNLLTKDLKLEPEGESIRRMSPAFKMRYVVPLDIKLDGVSGVGFGDGVDSHSMILNNQKSTEHTVKANEIKIFGKNISGLFIRNTGSARDLNSTTTNEENIADIQFPIKSLSTNYITFKTSAVIGS